MKDKLLALKKLEDNLEIAIICESKEEAIKLFSFKFPYEVNDLSGRMPWEGKYKRQGFTFKGMCHLIQQRFNTYSAANYYESRPKTYKCIKFKDYFNNTNYETF